MNLLLMLDIFFYGIEKTMKKLEPSINNAVFLHYKEELRFLIKIA